MGSLTKSERIVSWICRVVAAIILGQTLFFKFTGAEESIYIFTKVGLEPWGRYGSGAAELVAVILLLTPRFAWAGALLITFSVLTLNIVARVLFRQQATTH